MNMTVELASTIVGFVVAALGIVWRAESRMTAVRTECLRAVADAKDACTRQTNELHHRVTSLSQKLSDHQLHVSNNYLHNERAGRMEQSLMSAIKEMQQELKTFTRVTAKLDGTLTAMAARLDSIEKKVED